MSALALIAIFAIVVSFYTYFREMRKKVEREHLDEIARRVIDIRHLIRIEQAALDGDCESTSLIPLIGHRPGLRFLWARLEVNQDGARVILEASKDIDRLGHEQLKLYKSILDRAGVKTEVVRNAPQPQGEAIVVLG